MDSMALCWQELFLAWKKFNFSLTVKHEANNFVGSEAHTKHTHPSLTNMKGALTQMGWRQVKIAHRKWRSDWWCLDGWMALFQSSECGAVHKVSSGCRITVRGCGVEIVLCSRSLNVQELRKWLTRKFCNNIKYGGAICSVLLCFVVWGLTAAFSDLPKMSSQLMWRAFTVLAAWSALWWNSLAPFPVSAFVFRWTNGKEIVNH